MSLVSMRIEYIEIHSETEVCSAAVAFRPTTPFTDWGRTVLDITEEEGQLYCWGSDDDGTAANGALPEAAAAQKNRVKQTADPIPHRPTWVWSSR